VLTYFSLGEFLQPSEVNGWYANSIQTPFTIQDEAMVVNTTGPDPYFGRGLALPQDYRIVEFRFKVTAGAPWTSRIYWAENAVGRGMSEATSAPLQVEQDGEYHTYQFDFTQAVEGSLNNIRLDPGDGAGISLLLDYWRIGTLSPTLRVAAQLDGSLRLSWPAAATGYGLQTAPSLTGPWTDVTAEVLQEGEDSAVYVQKAGPVRFYRLIALPQ
jgi:hypothetical protein